MTADDLEEHKIESILDSRQGRGQFLVRWQSKRKLPGETVTKSFDNGASQITLDIPAIHEYEL